VASSVLTLHLHVDVGSTVRLFSILYFLRNLFGGLKESQTSGTSCWRVEVLNRIRCSGSGWTMWSVVLVRVGLSGRNLTLKGGPTSSSSVVTTRPSWPSSCGRLRSAPPWFSEVKVERRPERGGGLPQTHPEGNRTAGGKPRTRRGWRGSRESVGPSSPPGGRLEEIRVQSGEIHWRPPGRFWCRPVRTWTCLQGGAGLTTQYKWSETKTLKICSSARLPTVYK